MDEPEIITLGCRLNAFESEVVRDHARGAGLACTVVNTCAVTAEAVRQAQQTIRRLARENPKRQIIVTGCAAQLEPHRFAAMPEVGHVVGNGEKRAPDTFAAMATGTAPRVAVGDIMRITETASHLVSGFGAKPRAFVEIQNGCDHRCTFCTIPFARGPARSVPTAEVVAQVRRLIEAGAIEIVLTGVDLTSYGPDLPGDMTLGRLVAQILREVPEMRRLRLSSLDQIEAERDPALLDCFASDPRLMPHVHLSLQSGSDMILKRMRRRHLRADAIRFVERLRAIRADVVIGADLIAGFPTETDAMHAENLDIIDACGIAFVHVFPYSARPGTPAARMPQIAAPEIKRRAQALREKGAAALTTFLASEIGRTRSILVEGPRRGRTEHFVEVAIAGADPAVGQVVTARVTGARGPRLEGALSA